MRLFFTRNLKIYSNKILFDIELLNHNTVDPFEIELVQLYFKRYNIKAFSKH